MTENQQLLREACTVAWLKQRRTLVHLGVPPLDELREQQYRDMFAMGFVDGMKFGLEHAKQQMKALGAAP